MFIQHYPAPIPSARLQLSLKSAFKAKHLCNDCWVIVLLTQNPYNTNQYADLLSFQQGFHNLQNLAGHR